MAQVKVKINGRTYEVVCDDGQEEHVARLGRYLDTKVGELVAQMGQVGDTRLLVMAGLMITDELSEAYGELDDIRAGRSGMTGRSENGAGDGASAISGTTGDDDAREAEGLRNLAKRIEGIAEGIERA